MATNPVKSKLYRRYSELFYEQLRLYALHRKVIDLPADEGNFLWLIFATHQCTQKDLCNLLGQPKQTINNTVKKLQRDGLVEMVPVVGDRRKKELRLTQKGMERAESTSRLEVNAEYKALTAMPKEKREQFLTLWEELLENLRQEFKIDVDM